MKEGKSSRLLDLLRKVLTLAFLKIIVIDLCEKISPKRRSKFEWTVGPVTNKKTKGSTMNIVLTNEQQVVVHLNPVTGKGRPVALDGAPVWAVASGDCIVTPAADGLSATIVSGDLPGDSEISVSADADLGAGVVNISDAIRVTVNGAQASSLGLVADAPTDKP